jgi:multidrug efflux system membrane fusion protein
VGAALESAGERADFTHEHGRGEVKPLFRRWLPGLFLVGVAAGCAQGPPPPAPAAPPEVEISGPLVREVTDYEEFTGRTEAELSVQVRARVSGYLDKAYLDKSLIREGSEVNKGDLLFVIDPRPFKAALDAAAAQVALQEANLQLAKITYSRARSAAGRATGVVSPLELDQTRSQQAQAQASLDLAKANLATARINLDFTEVRAPISGRVSRRLVDANNVVTADQTLLTTVVSLDPAYVYFTVDERTLLRLRGEGQQVAGPSSASDPGSARVEMGLANEDGYSRQGAVNFEDNTVDPGTGTILMRGVFANPKTASGGRLLSPGMFARVRLPIGKPKRAVLVADRALGTDQGKKFLYVVKDEADPETGRVRPVVERRYVQPGALHGGLREILGEGKEGVLPAGQKVAPNERVIVIGLQRVRPGAEVAPKDVPMPTGGLTGVRGQGS